MVNSIVGVGAKFGGSAKDTVWVESFFDGLVEFFFWIAELAVGNQGFNATFWSTTSDGAVVLSNEGGAEAEQFASTLWIVGIFNVEWWADVVNAVNV